MRFNSDNFYIATEKSNCASRTKTMIKNVDQKTGLKTPL